MTPTDEMARLRTELANERTLLAYVRTGLAVVAAGVSLIAFFDLLAPRIVGWALSTAGIATFLIGVVRFKSIRRRL